MICIGFGQGHPLMRMGFLEPEAMGSQDPIPAKQGLS
jgi:hypothetical protein